MSRRWGATGVSDHVSIEIDAKARTQIGLELRARGVTSQIPEDFYKSLGEAISSFNSGRELAKASKPAKVRANLQAAIDAALVLNDRLNDLDGNSRQLLGEVENGEASVLQNVYLRKIIQALSDASHLADEYPERGRLPEHERLWLAVEVANAISTHLGITPTTTKDGAFESVLTIVLEIATGNRVSSVHDLARHALKAKQEQPDIIKHVPPKDD